MTNDPAPSPVKFADRLSALCAMELSASRGEPDRLAEMIERLANSLGFTIAILAEGDAKVMDNLLNGATAYLLESAADHMKVGMFMAAAPKRNR